MVISGEVAGGQVICEHLIDALRARGDEAFVVSPSSGDFVKRLEEKKVLVMVMPLARGFHLDYVWRLARFFKQVKADLVHTHAGFSENVHARLGSWLAGVPVVSHFHLPTYFRENQVIRYLQIFLDNLTTRLSAEIVAVSEATKKAMIVQGVPEDRVTTIYNGVDLDRFCAQRSRADVLAELGVPPRRMVIGMAARLCDGKGQKEFILAAHEVSRRVPEAIFLIIGKDVRGNGMYENDLKNLVETLELTEKVLFTGYRQDMADVLNAIDVFVLPSKIEGFPVSILEAMALGKPVIASSVGGVSELVVDRETGLLVSPNDVSTLALAIEQLATAPDMRHEMGRKGRFRVEEFFTLKKMVQQIFDLYERILAAPRGSVL